MEGGGKRLGRKQICKCIYWCKVEHSRKGVFLQRARQRLTLWLISLSVFIDCSHLFIFIPVSKMIYSVAGFAQMCHLIIQPNYTLLYNEMLENTKYSNLPLKKNARSMIVWCSPYRVSQTCVLVLVFSDTKTKHTGIECIPFWI